MPETIRVRVGARLAYDTEQRALSAGLCVSEYVRRALVHYRGHAPLAPTDAPPADCGGLGVCEGCNLCRAEVSNGNVS